MPRYFTVRKTRAWVEDEDAWGAGSPVGTPDAWEHEPTDTGLLDATGDTIMRAPNPVGFIWSDE